jgi:hypothetical protein
VTSAIDPAAMMIGVTAMHLTHGLPGHG